MKIRITAEIDISDLPNYHHPDNENDIYYGQVWEDFYFGLVLRTSEAYQNMIARSTHLPTRDAIREIDRHGKLLATRFLDNWKIEKID